MMSTEYLDQVTEAERRLREAIGEARGVTKDLRSLLRDIKAELGKADDMVGEHVKTQVRLHTEELVRVYKDLGEQVSAKLFRRFDDITNLLLGKDEAIEDPELAQQALRIRAATERASAMRLPPTVPKFWRQQGPMKGVSE
jgi:hypothetical protein